ncbi:eCIS core domain-containing protein [Natrialba chahannaoensis]|uniref:eCIS core domain-containing protein n=1 Tax=Natrialba chahannaoensis TaxID=68911 RepID=UPI001375B6C8|nr:DUF4157 domain-containing protein [Natrialba chahannaoensis]
MIRIYTGAAAQQACQELNARAFTVGNSIAFGPGEYDPQSTAGQHLIAHEVVHTLQQPDAPVSMMPKTELQMEIDPDPQAEREAEDVATQIMDGGDLGSQQMQGTDVHVQRVGSAVFTMASSAKNLLEMQRDQRRLEQEAQAAKFETLGNTEGDTEQRLSQLENAVSELGSYVASQVGPGPTLGEKMKSAVTDNVVTTAAGLTVGAGLAYAGLQTGSPEMAMASAPATAMTSTYAKHRAPDVNAVASQMAPDWADDIGGLVKHYVEKILGRRETETETGAGYDPYQGGDS